MKWLKDNYITLIILVVIITIMLQFKRIIEVINDFFKDEDKVDNPLDDSNSVLSDTLANTYANRLHSAMLPVGTDELEIYDVFENLKSQSDYNKVYNSFGKKQYSAFWGNGGDPITSSKRDLSFWLNNELTIEEKEYINTNYLVIF